MTLVTQRLSVWVRVRDDHKFKLMDVIRELQLQGMLITSVRAPVAQAVGECRLDRLAACAKVRGVQVLAASEHAIPYDPTLARTH